MKKSIIVFVEIGILLGIVAAFFLAPDDTPIVTFCVISGLALVLGNVWLVVKIRTARAVREGGQPPKQRSVGNEFLAFFPLFVLIGGLLWKYRAALIATFKH